MGNEKIGVIYSLDIWKVKAIKMCLSIQYLLRSLSLRVILAAGNAPSSTVSLRDCLFFIATG